MVAGNATVIHQGVFRNEEHLADFLCGDLAALSGITLLSCIGALVQDVDVHSLVYVFFVADLLVAILVMLTVGRLDRRPRRRSTTPARR